MADSSDSEDTMKEMANLKAAVETLTAEVNSLKSTKASLESEKVELVKANDALNATVDAFKKASRHSDRADAVMKVDATLSREQAIDKVKAFDELSDAGFSAMVELMKGYAEKAPREVTAAEVIDKAKAEPDARYGASPENTYAKVTADIKKFVKGPVKDGGK